MLPSKDRLFICPLGVNGAELPVTTEVLVVDDVDVLEEVTVTVLTVDRETTTSVWPKRQSMRK